MIRYLIGFFVTIGLVILLIVLLFSGGDSGSKKVPTSGKPLASYAATDAQVRMTIDGPINAEQDHRQIQITIDRTSAVLNVMQGYDGNVTDTHSFHNTQNGYAAFLHSLELLNFTKGDTASGSLKSEAGHCATGERYIFEVIQDNRDIERFWATSCNGQHTYQGNLQMTITLFQRQIPNYSDAAQTAGI